MRRACPRCVVDDAATQSHGACEIAMSISHQESKTDWPLSPPQRRSGSRGSRHQPAKPHVRFAVERLVDLSIVALGVRSVVDVSRKLDGSQGTRYHAMVRSQRFFTQHRPRTRSPSPRSQHASDVADRGDHAHHSGLWRPRPPPRVPHTLRTAYAASSLRAVTHRGLLQGAPMLAHSFSRLLGSK